MRGRHGSSSPPTASPRSIPSAAGPGLLRLVSALGRRRLHPRPLRNSSSSLHLALTPTPGAGCGEHHRFPASGAPPRVSSRGSILGSRVRVSGFHLREGSRFVVLCLCDLPLFLPRVSMIAPGPLRLRRCDVSVRRGAFGVRKADGRRWSRRLSLFRTLVLAIVLSQSGDAQTGRGTVPTGLT